MTKLSKDLCIGDIVNNSAAIMRVIEKTDEYLVFIFPNGRRWSFVYESFSYIKMNVIGNTDEDWFRELLTL